MLGYDFAWLNYDNEFNRLNEEATRNFFIDEEPALASRSGQSVSSEGCILI